MSYYIIRRYVNRSPLVGVGYFGVLIRYRLFNNMIRLHAESSSWMVVLVSHVYPLPSIYQQSNLVIWGMRQVDTLHLRKPDEII